MRERGARATDIAVVVIAVDDGIMPQTVESINFAQQAGVPIVVAFSKCDKLYAPSAADGPASRAAHAAAGRPASALAQRLSRIREELLKYSVICEEFGGDTQSVPVSAVTGYNIERLLDALIVQGELLELYSDPQAKVHGTVIESRVIFGLGPCATVLVEQGTVTAGCHLVSDGATCRVRTISDHTGRRLERATPSMPVSISGWCKLAPVGGAVVQVESEREANEAVALFEQSPSLVMEQQRERQRILAERAAAHDQMWALRLDRRRDASKPLPSTVDYEAFIQDPTASLPKLSLFIRGILSSPCAERAGHSAC